MIVRAIDIVRNIINQAYTKYIEFKQKEVEGFRIVAERLFNEGRLEEAVKMARKYYYAKKALREPEQTPRALIAQDDEAYYFFYKEVKAYYTETEKTIQELWYRHYMEDDKTLSVVYDLEQERVEVAREIKNIFKDAMRPNLETLLADILRDA